MCLGPVVWANERLKPSYVSPGLSPGIILVESFLSKEVYNLYLIVSNYSKCLYVSIGKLHLCIYPSW